MRIGLAWWALLLLGLWASYSHAQQCTQSQLNQEFTQDPTARAYVDCASDGVVTGPSNNDQCTLDKFNAPCTNNAACKVDQIITREHFYEIIDSVEYAAMLKDTAAAERKDGMMIASNMATFNMSITEVRDKLQDIFPQGKAPITNQLIKDAQKKNASRAEIVCHRPGTLADVSCGLRGDGCP